MDSGGIPVSAISAITGRRRSKDRFGAIAFVCVLAASIVCWIAVFRESEIRENGQIVTEGPASVESTTRLTQEPRPVPTFQDAALVFTASERFGMSSIDESAAESATRVPLLRCSDGTLYSEYSVRLHKGLRWQIAFRRDDQSVLVVASRPCAVTARARTWTGDDGLAVSTAPFIGEHWIEVHAINVANQSSTGAATCFLRPISKCGQSVTYGCRLALPAGMYRVIGHLLYNDFDHVDETREDAPLRYADPSDPESSNLFTPIGEMCISLLTDAGDVLNGPGTRWKSLRRYEDNDKVSSLSGYWLRVKGEQLNPSAPYFTHDILGRMNYGRWYEPSSPATSEVCDRQCFLSRLRHRTIYFIGDSHMRIFFYGFLARLKIPFPQNKVWRGDRTDYVASHNVTIKFVASYFLNLTRPTAKSALQDRNKPIVVAGVGQHHSCHCWSLMKHRRAVATALDQLLSLQPVDDDPLTIAPRTVIWFGVPGQPVNRHLHIPKPVGQSRMDCRNNARHWLFNEAQRELVQKRNTAAKVVFLDAFQRSVGMTHTSLDGAHFYTWVREAWINDLGAALERPG